MFVTLADHAAAIGNTLAALEEDREWFNVADWLLLAASIESVVVCAGKHDSAWGFCEAASEFENAYAELREGFVDRLTVFMFVWSALEAAIDVIDPPPDPAARGKIRAACRYLYEQCTDGEFLLGLSDTVAEFKRLAHSCEGLQKAARRLDEVEVGPAGAGLYAVYELRNQFAHGSLNFPMPDEENRPIGPHQTLIETATRIVLLELQMLLLVTLDRSQLVWSAPVEGLDGDAPIDLVLRACHLAKGVEWMQVNLLSATPNSD